MCVLDCCLLIEIVVRVAVRQKIFAGKCGHCDCDAMVERQNALRLRPQLRLRTAI